MDIMRPSIVFTRFSGQCPVAVEYTLIISLGSLTKLDKFMT